MQAVSPVMPGSEPLEVLLGEKHDMSAALPALYLESPFRPMITRWRFTEAERAKIANGADLIMQQLTFSQPFLPTDLQVVDPNAMPTLVDD